MVETLPQPKMGHLLPEVIDAPPEKRLLTREEYHKMAEAGIFRPDERLELINGEVYKKMSPQKSSHFFVVDAVQEALKRAFGDAFVVRAQAPVTDGANSEPEPDICVVRGSRRDFAAAHPWLAQTALVVEVTDTSLRTDRRVKAPVYARAGVADYWVVNLKNRTVEVYREPASLRDDTGEFGYRGRRIYSEGETISPLAAPEASVAVDDILPPE